MSRKLEEKRQRRLERERRDKEKRKEARRRNMVTVGIALVVMAVVGSLIYSDRKQAVAGLVFGPSAAEADCGEIEEFKEAKGDHIEASQVPSADQYTSIPPTSGPMWEPLMPGGFTDRPVALPEPLHSLEHGVIVVYYKDLDDAEREALENYATSNSAEVIAAPASEGVDDKITLTGWRNLQPCNELSTEAIDEFVERFKGAAPESAAA